MQTILIPVDFSDHSVSTYKFAIKIVGTVNETRLYFLHSYNDQLLIPDSGLSSGFDNDVFMNMQLIEEFKQLAKNNMKQLKKEVEDYIKAEKLNNFKVNTMVSGGDPGWEITDASKDIHPDFIVMGTQGIGKKGILEGSMAKKIMNKADVPVIAVPSGEYDHDNLRIMYASNNHEKDFVKIKLLFKLFENLPFKIFTVHFHFEGSSHDNSNQLNDLKEAFSAERISKQINFSLIDTNNKDNALEAFVEHNNINVIAFIAHKSNIFKSLFRPTITKKDFFKLGLPMIALHE
ncbi:MAG TPA: universal stress protein [Bacteroidales bacterium]|jgi:nucleotide-binding universal stress UspA family protein|nr:universal stress protein [Bacteroidales bacterium]|tara:strand:+ start:101 stop:970 length:870 start_codon:yes stop_codon:yes gene_type:complete